MHVCRSRVQCWDDCVEEMRMHEADEPHTARQEGAPVATGSVAMAHVLEALLATDPGALPLAFLESVYRCAQLRYSLHPKDCLLYTSPSPRD